MWILKLYLSITLLMFSSCAMYILVFAPSSYELASESEIRVFNNFLPKLLNALMILLMLTDGNG